KAFLVTGSPGGSTIITSTLQVILNTLVFDMDIADAVEAPRFHHQWQPDKVQYEAYGISPDTLSKLKSFQHKRIEISEYPLGDTNSILLKSDSLEAVNDPRRRGGASAF